MDSLDRARPSARHEHHAPHRGLRQFRNSADEPVDHGIARSRGGLSTGPPAGRRQQPAADSPGRTRQFRGLPNAAVPNGRAERGTVAHRGSSPGAISRSSSRSGQTRSPPQTPRPAPTRAATSSSTPSAPRAGHPLRQTRHRLPGRCRRRLKSRPMWRPKMRPRLCCVSSLPGLGF